jgi:uncharacterized membrane protein YeaQ/YmgE (transglycosylase-associated protein family)
LDRVLIVIAVFGLIVGAVGRLLVPGPTRLGVLGTMGAGVAGALLGGFVGRLFLGPNLTHGWIWVLSILGAALVVWLVSRRGVGYGGRTSRRGLMWERPYDDRVVVDGGNREYRSGRGRWSRGGLLPRPAYGHRADVDDGYGYGSRRRRRFF